MAPRLRKTSLGQVWLSAQLPFIDLDQEITTQVGLSIGTFYPTGRMVFGRLKRWC
jgi:shikimate kinase